MGVANDTPQIGYRVLGVYSDSPMADIGVEPMLDYIVGPGINGSEDRQAFEEALRQAENKEIELTFYNIASQSTWKAKVQPRRWKGRGLLGADIRSEDYTTAHAHVLRVLNFYVGSPLEKAGFKTHTDYILGTEHYTFQDMDDFRRFIALYDQKPVDLWVYSSDTCCARVLTLTPDSHWGGSGSLGGDFGFGYVNSLPARAAKPSNLPKHLKAWTGKTELDPKPGLSTQTAVSSKETKPAVTTPASAPSPLPAKAETLVQETHERQQQAVLGVNEEDVLVGQSQVPPTATESKPEAQDVII